MNRIQKDNLLETMLDLFEFAENKKISNPFFANRLGSRMHQDCKELFVMILYGHLNRQRNDGHGPVFDNPPLLTKQTSLSNCLLDKSVFTTSDEPNNDDDDNDGQMTDEQILLEFYKKLKDHNPNTKIAMSMRFVFTKLFLTSSEEIIILATVTSVFHFHLNNYQHQNNQRKGDIYHLIII